MTRATSLSPLCQMNLSAFFLSIMMFAGAGRVNTSREKCQCYARRTTFLWQIKHILSNYITYSELSSMTKMSFPLLAVASERRRGELIKSLPNSHTELSLSLSQGKHLTLKHVKSMTEILHAFQWQRKRAFYYGEKLPFECKRFFSMENLHVTQFCGCCSCRWKLNKKLI